VFSVSGAGALSPVAGSPFLADAVPVSVAFDPTGRLLAVASGGNVAVFSTAIDPPAVSIDAPTDRAHYTLGQVAAYSCAEGTGGPGIASCAGTVHSGSRIDTTQLGRHRL
jgi:hypothetical protein